MSGQSPLLRILRLVTARDYKPCQLSLEQHGANFDASACREHGDGPMLKDAVDVRLEALLLIEHELCQDFGMAGRLIPSPVGTVKKILEIGCGTGTTTIQLAQDFPEAIVVGLDRAAVPPVNVKPANVAYVTGKFEELVQSDHPALGKGTFDLIYSRFVSQGIGQWSKHIELCHDLLAPGGFLELHETDGSALYSARSPDAHDPRTTEWKWHQFVMDECLNYGVTANDIGRLGDIMEQVGFGSVGCFHYPFVFYPWPARPETEAIGKYCERFTPMVIKQMIALLGRDTSGPLRVQAIQEEVDETLGKAEIEGLHFRFYVWFGQKKTE